MKHEPLTVPDSPDGLDARPLVVFTVHCNHCGRPAPAYEADDDGKHPAWWTREQLNELGTYYISHEYDWHLDLKGADPVFAGRRVVCPKCWQAGWCEDDNCDINEGLIHAWDAHWHDEHNRYWHTACRWARRTDDQEVK